VIILRDYEAVIILKPHLLEEELNKIISTIEDNIVQRNGELITEPHIEKRKLAYQIEKFSDGYYAFIYYVGNTEIVKRLDELCRFNENVLRFVNFRLETRDNILHGVTKSSSKDESIESEEDEEEEV